MAGEKGSGLYLVGMFGLMDFSGFHSVFSFTGRFWLDMASRTLWTSLLTSRRRFRREQRFAGMTGAHTVKIWALDSWVFHAWQYLH